MSEVARQFDATALMYMGHGTNGGSSCVYVTGLRFNWLTTSARVSVSFPSTI